MKRRSPSLYTKKFYRRVRAKDNTSTVPRAIVNTPRLPVLWQKLTYNDYQLVLDPGAAGTAASYVLAANGLYDVDITGVGHQPTNFDQLMGLYAAYVVTEAEIEVNFWNLDTTYAQVVGISAQENTTTSTDTRRYVENGNCVSRVIGNASGASSNITTLKMKVNMNEFFKYKKILSDDTFQGTASANPVDGAYFHIFAAPMNSADNGAQVFARVTIVFKAVFRNPTLNSLS